MKQFGLIAVFFVIPFLLFWGSFQFHHRPELEAKLEERCAGVFDGQAGLENVRVSFENNARDAVLVGRVATRADLERAESFFAARLKEDAKTYPGVRAVVSNRIAVEGEAKPAEVKTADSVEAGMKKDPPAVATVEPTKPPALPPAPDSDSNPAPDPAPRPGTDENPEPVAPTGPGPSRLEVIAGADSIVLIGRLAGEDIEKELSSSAESNRRERSIVKKKLWVVPETSKGAWEAEIYLVLNLLLEATTECRLLATGKKFEIGGVADNELTHGALLALCKDLESRDFEVVHRLELAAAAVVKAPDLDGAEKVEEGGEGAGEIAEEGEEKEPEKVNKPDTTPPPAAPKPEPDEAFLADLKAATVYFASGVSTLNEKEDVRLAKVAQGLGKYPNLKLTIAGFGDSEGDAEINRKMTLKRANAVKSALVKHGVASDRAEVVDKGAGKPIGKRPGRRVELRVGTESINE